MDNNVGVGGDMGVNNNPSRLQIDTHLQNLQEPARSAMVTIRNFVKSLGNNVIEEIRPHRIVYAKTLNFRTFLDVRPLGDSLAITIRKSRAGQPIQAAIKTVQDAEDIKLQIAEAFERIQ